MELDEIKHDMSFSFKAGNYAQALQYAEDALQLAPRDVDAIVTKATILSLPMPESCDYETAQSLIKSLIQDSPGDIKRLLGGIYVMDSTGEYAESESYCREILKLDPSNYDAIIMMAALHAQPDVQVQQDEVKYLLEKAIEAFPERWHAYSYLARIMASQGRLLEAVYAYKHALMGGLCILPFMRQALDDELAQTEARLRSQGLSEGKK